MCSSVVCIIAWIIELQNSILNPIFIIICTGLASCFPQSLVVIHNSAFSVVLLLPLLGVFHFKMLAAFVCLNDKRRVQIL